MKVSVWLEEQLYTIIEHVYGDQGYTLASRLCTLGSLLWAPYPGLRTMGLAWLSCFVAICFFRVIILQTGMYLIGGRGHWLGALYLISITSMYRQGISGPAK